MVVAARKSGVVTKIGSDDLVEEARRVECVLELVPALGEFVPAGAPSSAFTSPAISTRIVCTPRWSWRWSRP